MKYAHTSITALDWKKLSDFYINVFRCTLASPVKRYSGAWVDKVTGLCGAQVAGVSLALPGYGANGPVLEIFSYQELVEKGPVMPNQKGYTHIAFQVEDIEETLDQSIKNGGGQLGEIAEIRVEGAGTLKLLYLRDPEGNLIELQSRRK